MGEELNKAIEYGTVGPKANPQEHPKGARLGELERLPFWGLLYPDPIENGSQHRVGGIRARCSQRMMLAASH